jgi:hypothetical protein
MIGFDGVEESRAAGLQPLGWRASKDFEEACEVPRLKALKCFHGVGMAFCRL